MKILGLIALLTLPAISQAGEPSTAATAAPLAVTVETPPASTAELGDVKDFSTLDLAALLDVKVETASKKSENISKAPAIIEVLTRQQIYDLGVRDLYTALTYLPGIEVFHTYSGYMTLAFRGQLQEIYNSKILLLVNGHPSYEIANGSFYLEEIPLEAISRIEVIRGPGSVLYGTNAFAGVINIITDTQKDEGVGGIARAEGGSFRTLSGGAGAGGRHGDLLWSLYGSGVGSKGYPYTVLTTQNEDCLPGGTPRACDCPASGKSAQFPMYNNYGNAFGDLQWKGFKVQFGGVMQDYQKYAIVPLMRYHGPSSATHYFVGASYRYETEKFFVEVKGNLDNEKRSWDMGHFPLETNLPTFAKNDGLLTRGEVGAGYTPVKSFTAEIGFSGDRTKATFFNLIQSDGKLNGLSPNFDVIPQQSNVAGYAQATWRPRDNVTVLLGDRFSWFESAMMAVKLSGALVQTAVVDGTPRTNNSPRGGIVYSPVDEWTFKLLYGAAYRQPSLFEAAAVLKKVIGTSPNMKPETIKTTELGVDGRLLERIGVRLNGFYSLTNDVIGRRAPAGADEIAKFGSTSTIYDNLPGQRSWGAEAGLHVIMNEQASLFANTGWKRVLDTGSHQFIKDFAAVTANGGVDYKPFAWLAVKPNAQFIGHRGQSKAYSLANLVIDVPVTKNLTVSAIGTNLADTKYTYPEYIRRNVDTLPGDAGRAFYGRITAEF